MSGYGRSIASTIQQPARNGVGQRDGCSTLRAHHQHQQTGGLLSTSAAVSARLEAFCDSSAKLAAGLNDALSRLERVQFNTMLITAPDGPVALESFIPAAGSVEQRLLDELTLRRSIAAALEHYARFILALGRGDEAADVEKARHLFEAASEELEGALPAGTVMAATEAHLGTAAGAATPAPPHAPMVARLEAAGGHARFAIGMVAKMANDSTPGKIAGLVGMVSDGITRHLRMEEGMKLLAAMLPNVQPDVEGLTKALVASEEPLTAAANALAGRLIEWSNAHRPSADDPARFAYNSELASLLADARQVLALTHAAAETSAKLAAAHVELGQLAASVPTDGEAIKALVKSAERLARHRR